MLPGRAQSQSVCAVNLSEIVHSTGRHLQEARAFVMSVLLRERRKSFMLWPPPTPQYVHLLSWLNLPRFSAILATLSLNAPWVSAGDTPPLECLIPFQHSLPLLMSSYRSHLLTKAFFGHKTDLTPALMSQVLSVIVLSRAVSSSLVCDY